MVRLLCKEFQINFYQDEFDLGRLGVFGLREI
jgi:hypothetical protein